MSPVAPRSLLTATAAGALLAALWFIPTAHATADRMTPAADARSGATAVVQGHADAPPEQGTATLTTSEAADTGTGAAERRLTDTGDAETTLYLFGGTAVLGLGAGFVAYSVRQGRVTAY